MAEPAYPEHLRDLVETYLANLDFGAADRVSPLVEAMRYSLLAGGKRIRPVLTLAVAEQYGRPPTAFLPTAAAFELIHTYSLIHDDLPAIDNDDLRRGKATCHVVYGEDIAILAGDALFAEAFRLVLENQEAPADVVVAVVTEVARATGVRGMVGGQYMDVVAAVAGDEDLRVLHALKTGRLIEAAVVCGALLAQARELEPLRRFAREIGVLFQIVDDILDVRGEEAVIGKTAGQDERLHKVTYVSRFGLERAAELARERHDNALALLASLVGDTAGLRAVTDYIYARNR